MFQNRILWSNQKTVQMIEAYPLCWPVGYARTKRPQDARFKTTFAIARDCIIEEIKRLGGKSPIISTNIPLKRDGLPYASFRQPEDAGVAVYFTYQGQQVVFACDKWNRIHDNMQAIRKAIEAIRGLERWGVSDMLKRAFTGFKALSQNVEENLSWFEILGCSEYADEEEIKSAYRKAAKKYHPDNSETGSAEKFKRIKTAYDVAMSLCSVS